MHCHKLHQAMDRVLYLRPKDKRSEQSKTSTYQLVRRSNSLLVYSISDVGQELINTVKDNELLNCGVWMLSKRLQHHQHGDHHVVSVTLRK